MAALIIQTDGALVANANSYVTVKQAQAFAEARGIDLIADSDTAQINLIKAMDYIESIADFQGVMTYEDQVLLWPRYGVYLNDLRFDKLKIPNQLKTAQIQLAIAAAGGLDLAPTSTGSEMIVTKEKVGPIETEYAKGATFGTTMLGAAQPLLDALRVSYGGFMTVRV